jgi:hypothetical protein
MRWEITKRAWNLAKRHFPEAKSLYMSLPVRFKMSGAIPVHDLSTKAEIGALSYKVMSGPVDTTLVLQCKEEQVAYVLPPAKMMTFATARSKADIKESDKEHPPEDKFNYRSAKSKTERNVKDFPSTVHVVQDGNAMIVADVLQVRMVRHKNKKFEWWQVRPAGSSNMFWVLSDFIRPIKAGTVVAATAPVSQVARGLHPATSFGSDDVIWLRDKMGQLFGPLYVIQKRANEVQVMPSQHGLGLFPGMYSNHGDFKARAERDEWISLKDYSPLIGEWRAKTFRDLDIGDEFRIFDYTPSFRKQDNSFGVLELPSGETAREFDGLDIVFARDQSLNMSKFDPWRQVTGPGNNSALQEAKKILTPGTAVTLTKRGFHHPLETMGTFEKWEQMKNPMNPSQRGPLAMIIRIDDTGTVVRILPNSEQREWDVKVYGATTIDESFKQGHIWALCDDPIMEDPVVKGNLLKNNNPGTVETPEKMVAILSIEGNEVLARAGDILVRVPKSSLKPAVKSDKGLPWVKRMQENKHPYLKDDVLLRDGKQYVVIKEPTDPKVQRLRFYESFGDSIAVKDESSNEALIPNDGANEYVGVSLGKGQTAKPMSMRSKALRTDSGQEEKQPPRQMPPASMPNLPSPPLAPEI